MSAWALKLAATIATMLVFLGSWGYAAGHVKNAKAPLQPPVATSGAALDPSPPPSAAPTAVPSLLTTRPGVRRPSGSPGPLLTLQPGVQATALPPITITHVS